MECVICATAQVSQIHHGFTFDHGDNIGQIVLMRRPSNLGAMWTAGRIAARRVLRRKEGAQDERLGEALSDQLDQMKGLAMKVGQIVSYMDVPLPSSVQEKLARLQRGMQGMPEAKTRAALAAALGADWASRFDAFEIEPFAAASIGQVHRASFEGQPIAFKLRYPEVADTMSSDLGTMRRIASLASLASAVNGQAIVDELAARLSEECDYEREARYQSLFRCAFADDPDIVIPDVHASLSTESTIATAWCDGSTLEVACEAHEATRNRYARALVRFSYRSLFELGTIQADPHPGNFLFGDDGRVTCLDFGCVRAFDPELVQALRAMLVALDHGDHPGFREAIVAIGMAPKPKRFDFEHAFRMMEHLNRPLLQPRFAFTPAFVREGMDYNGPTNPNARHMDLPAPYLWVVRLQWGLWSLLTRLRADVALRDIIDDLLTHPIGGLTDCEADAARSH